MLLLVASIFMALHQLRKVKSKFDLWEKLFDWKLMFLNFKHLSEKFTLNFIE